MTRKLNLGCGTDTRNGWTNMDIREYDGVDIVHDADQFPYPFDDNTFNKVYASHVLEHLENPFKTMEELHRICKTGAEIELWTPHFTSSDAYGDLTHQSPGFSCRFMDYFTQDEYVPNYHPDAAFNITHLALRFNKLHYPWNTLIQPLANIAPRWWENSPLRVFPANDIHIKLQAV